LHLERLGVAVLTAILDQLLVHLGSTAQARIVLPLVVALGCLVIVAKKPLIKRFKQILAVFQLLFLDEED